MKGNLLVAAQLAAIGVILSQASPAWLGPLPLAGFGMAFLLLGWAVASMGLRRVRVRPEPGAESNLCRGGPYRWIRHPMYSAVLLGTVVIVLVEGTWVAACAWVALLLVLLAKARFEEQLLVEAIPEYASYRRATKRFIPFLF